jgi:hypothetical protein
MIADLFGSYRQHVIPPDASPDDIKNHSWSFFAGAYALLLMLIEATKAMDPDDLEMFIDALKTEGDTFIENQAREIRSRRHAKTDHSN